MELMVLNMLINPGGIHKVKDESKWRMQGPLNMTYIVQKKKKKQTAQAFYVSNE